MPDLLFRVLSKLFPKGQQRDDFLEVTRSDFLNSEIVGINARSIVKGAVVQSLKYAISNRFVQTFALCTLGVMYLMSIIGRPGFDWVLLILLILLGFKATVGSLYLNLKANSKSSLLLMMSSFSSLALILILTMGAAISCSDCSDPYLGSSSALLPFDF